MRHLRLTFGLAAAICAFALSATPALAGEFVSSKAGTTKGSAETEQHFKFGRINVTCYKVRTKGLVAAGSASTYATSVKFGKCLTSARIGTHQFFLRAHFLTPLAIEYFPNGYVKVGSELKEEGGRTVLAGGTAALKFNTGATEEFEKSECEVYIPEQTIPKKAINNPDETFLDATYLNKTQPHKMSNEFPLGLQTYFTVTNEWTGMKYELEGEPCEEWGKEEGSEGIGQFSGSFPQVLGGGNLES